jgi:hypothetical protein
MVGERYWLLIGRSFWDAVDAVGQKVRVVIPATLIATFLPIWALGLKWDRAALAALVAAALAYPAMFVCAFVESLVSNARHPHEHKEWSIEPAHVLGNNIEFRIRSKIGTPYLEGHACEVRHPNGQVYRASTDIPGNGFRFLFWYARDFGDDAPPPVTFDRCERELFSRFNSLWKAQLEGNPQACPRCCLRGERGPQLATKRGGPRERWAWACGDHAPSERTAP